MGHEVSGGAAGIASVLTGFQLPTSFPVGTPVCHVAPPEWRRIPCLAPDRRGVVPMDGATDAWFEREVAGCRFTDERLKKRLRTLLERMGDAMGDSIPLACQDWANTKAAYRFFSNDRISEAEILAGHFQSTRDRVTAADGPLLVVHDTTEFSYQRERPERIGLTYRVNSGKDTAGRFRMHTVCGLLMHASLAVQGCSVPPGDEGHVLV